MSILANLSYDESIENEKDVLGSGFKVFDSGIYTATIKLAYLSPSQSGAMGIAMVFDLGDKQEYRETFWVTNREGKNFYVNRDNEKKYLDGFVKADSIALLAAKKPLSKLDTEKKVIKLMKDKKETATEVDMLMDLIGQEIKLGLVKQKVFKQEKDGNGVYQDTAETREQNSINKVFRASDDRTTAEVRAQSESAEFMTKWKEKWDGQVQDRTAAKAGGNKVQQGAPRAAKPTSESLFS